MLSTEAVEQYKRDGYYFPVEALTPDEARHYRQRLEEYEARSGGPLKGEMRQKPHLLFTWLDDLIRHPRILDAVEDVLGPDILCWSTSFFIKEPDNKNFVSWHQDATYWGLSSPDVTTAWLALTPANEVNGCMKFVPGTQHEQVQHSDTFNEANLLTRGQELAVEVDESRAVAVELEPGQASLHHVLLHHGSAPNRSTDRRIGFAMRYVPTYVRQIAGERDSAMLVRGTDKYGNFELERPPSSDLSPDALALHAEVTRRQQQVLYRGTGKTEFRA